MPQLITSNPYLLVIDKPAGVITHSDGRTVEPSVAGWLAEKYPEQRGIGTPWVSPQGEVVDVCGLVHRLDRTTSGVLLAARSQEVFDYVRGEFKARRVEKAYRALVYGWPDDAGRIVAAIERTGQAQKKWEAVPCEETHPRAAVTDWRVVIRGEEAGEPWACIEAYPRTGRTHQIRVHLASVGHPIIADHLYAPDRAPLLGLARPALHALSISVTLPSGARETYTAPMPDDIKNACADA
jgi:23S rRNA pseudouridine1911/1915/1917 synthase